MNTQINEDYCSFEVAKLIKEKGFNWKWSPFYSEQDRDEWSRNNNYNIPNPNYDANIPFDSKILNVIAPHVSLQMAMKWLREVYNIFIQVDYIWSPKELYTYTFDIHNMKSARSIFLTPYGESFNSYKESCEAAIKYCLINLI